MKFLIAIEPGTETTAFGVVVPVPANLETAFSDEERQLARISRHLCPTALGIELAQLSGSVDVHITHIKPGEMEAVMAEIGRLGTLHRIHASEAGQVMTLG